MINQDRKPLKLVLIRFQHSKVETTHGRRALPKSTGILIIRVTHLRTVAHQVDFESLERCRHLRVSRPDRGWLTPHEPSSAARPGGIAGFGGRRFETCPGRAANPVGIR
jgi:hypothetical protein